MQVMPVDVLPYRPEPIITGNDMLAGDLSYRRPQGLDDYLLVLTLGGHTILGSGPHKFLQTTGDLIFIDPHRPIDQDTTTPWPRIWAIFHPRPHWHEWLNWPALAPGYRQIYLPDVRRSPVRTHMEAMHRHASGAHWRGRELAMNSLEAAIIWCDAYNPRSQRTRLDPRVAAAMEFICRNFRRRLTLDEISEAVDLSIPHLLRLFRRHLRLTPMQYLERQRMQHAGELLQLTGQKISVIAAQVGFEDLAYFSMRFKRYAKVSPRAYRAARGIEMSGPIQARFG